jgi:hypothetical protein
MVVILWTCCCAKTGGKSEAAKKEDGKATVRIASLHLALHQVAQGSK